MHTTRHLQNSPRYSQWVCFSSIYPVKAGIYSGLTPTLARGRMQKVLFLLSLLPAFGALNGAAQGAPTPASQTVSANGSVLVRLGDLAWVAAREGLPRSSGGRIMVPPLAACDLLGLQCQVRGNNLDATGPLGKLSVALHQGFTQLRPLSLITGANVQYDPQSGAAVLSPNPSYTGVAKAPWLSILHDIKGKGQPIDQALRLQLGPITEGQPTRRLSLTSPQGLQGVRPTLFSKTGNVLNIAGHLTPSTQDVKHVYRTCQAACTLNIPRGALWTLAYLSK